MIYLFDMDGTLTPPRLPMTDRFAKRMLPWLKEHRAFIVTGSDYKKITEQVPQDVVDSFEGIYCSMGNVLMKKGEVLYERTFVPPEGLIEDLERFRQLTAYDGPLYDNYIEKRPGMINFSPLGRNCPYEARIRYKAWDDKTKERMAIRDELSKKYPMLEVSVGGSISIDITPVGGGKGQVARHIRQAYPEEEIHFFGDRTFFGGNDYELSQELAKLPNTRTIQIEGPDEVSEILKI